MWLYDGKTCNNTQVWGWSSCGPELPHRKRTMYVPLAPLLYCAILYFCCCARILFVSNTTEGTLQWKRRSHVHVLYLCAVHTWYLALVLVIMIESGVKGGRSGPSLRVRTSRAKKKKKMQM